MIASFSGKVDLDFLSTHTTPSLPHVSVTSPLHPLSLPPLFHITHSLTSYFLYTPIGNLSLLILSPTSSLPSSLLPSPFLPLQVLITPSILYYFLYTYIYMYMYIHLSVFSSYMYLLPSCPPSFLYTHTVYQLSVDCLTCTDCAAVRRLWTMLTTVLGHTSGIVANANATKQRHS